MDFRKELVKAIAAAGIDEKTADALLQKPPSHEMGDYALPCFKLAAGKSPLEFAKELAEKIELPKPFKPAQAKGPYVNFFIGGAEYAGHVIGAILQEKEKYGMQGKAGGSAPSGKKAERIIVEYCQANPLKAFHIGHVRNICMGESIARLFEAQGKKVIRVDYGGDGGPHVSKTLYAYRNLPHGPEPKGLTEKEKWLGELYSAGAKAVKENPGLEGKMREMVVALEGGKDKQLVADWKHLREMSIQCFKRIFSELDVEFDRIILESEVEKEGIRTAKELYEQGIAIKDQGALLIDLTKHGLEKFLILKSDGAALYSSKDIALSKLKKKEFGAERSYNVVGAEQSFYFRQLTKTLELLNERKPEYCPTEHISYELVRLEGAKMSSREGNVITYAELFSTVFGKALFETQKRHEGWDKKRIEGAAKSITLAAIKFGMVASDRNKVITFNWEKAGSLEGETGPFVQYSHARATSILSRAGKFKMPQEVKLGEEKERQLVTLLESYPAQVREAMHSYSPHKIAHYLLSLASAFNSFYQELQVLQAPSPVRESRLALVKASTIVLQNGLKTLNIDAPSEM